MCQFGNETKIIQELELTEDQALKGYRENYIINSFNNEEKFLRSLNVNYIWPKNKPAIGNPTKLNSKGIYNYNYYYNNYNYNYCYYNYYNNYYFNNNYYNNYNYYIQIITKLFGKIFEYKEGYRSQYCYPTHFVIIDKNSKLLIKSNTVDFAGHFNLTVENLAKEYNCEVIECSKVK